MIYKDIMDKLDIQGLRQNSRNSEFCESINELQLDRILKELLENDKLNFTNKIDLLASICNILSTNREIYTNHFQKHYSKKYLQYLVEFIEFYNDSHGVVDNPLSYIAIFRSFFLTLYGIKAQDKEELFEKASELLINDFYCLLKNYDEKSTECVFLNVMIEVLKALYALFHNYTGPKDNSLHLRCIRLINKIYKNRNLKIQKDKIQVIDNLLNLLQTFEYELNLDDEDEANEYSQFHKILLFLLEERLDKNESSGSFSIINLLPVINKEVSKLNNQHNSIKYAVLRDQLFVVTIPENKDGIYKSLLNIVIGNNNTSSSKYDARESMYLNNLVLDLFFQTSWSNEYKEQVAGFLEKCGYILGKSYLDNNELRIPSDLDISKFLEPKYFGDSIKYNSFADIIKNLKQDTNSNVEELSQEEKEIEAEKLFVLFDRMEKTGAFQNFENPVREWQQSGKFEELE